MQFHRACREYLSTRWPLQDASARAGRCALRPWRSLRAAGPNTKAGRPVLDGDEIARESRCNSVGQGDPIGDGQGRADEPGLDGVACRLGTRQAAGCVPAPKAEDEARHHLPHGDRFDADGQRRVCVERASRQGDPRRPRQRPLHRRQVPPSPAVWSRQRGSCSRRQRRASAQPPRPATREALQRCGQCVCLCLWKARMPCCDQRGLTGRLDGAGSPSGTYGEHLARRGRRFRAGVVDKSRTTTLYRGK